MTVCASGSQQNDESNLKLKGYQLQYSGLENSTDYHPWDWKSRTLLSDFHFTSLPQPLISPQFYSDTELLQKQGQLDSCSNVCLSPCDEGIVGSQVLIVLFGILKSCSFTSLDSGRGSFITQYQFHPFPNSTESFLIWKYSIIHSTSKEVPSFVEQFASVYSVRTKRWYEGLKSWSLRNITFPLKATIPTLQNVDGNTDWTRWLKYYPKVKGERVLLEKVEGVDKRRCVCMWCHSVVSNSL